MKRSILYVLVGVVAMVALVMFSIQNGDSSENYVTSVLNERADRDEFMKSNEGSPFKKDELTFEGLKYFDVDEAYRVKAKLEPIEKKKVVIIGTSDGKEQKYLEYAHAIFDLNGSKNKLLILEVMETGPQRGKLFLAFADETSGNETYGAGRYLDLKKVAAATSVVLDFNLAYNPYCAYTDSYTCPLPPRENILKIAIRAGEKSYQP
ncbi:MAG: DUF1684 domain-containing protein [Cyclobacteriaceae bacterium]|jgi:hypothetical protein|nr:DUF1684 domain-containing protein [Cyclobacteriaceae bacterium]